ncbi:MAG: 16S rRNA (guanine(966)-N(2))-methyltransferase RsmD [Clostridia bacterium]|nr:16S rRNA (guanine(966)-N(2))-methyltransferase RsmD [Clostridia bacterium]
MRIIGGKYKSRVLASFDGDAVRPTADRVKESLFNILSLRFYGARVLDLFSGSGALGLESLSRGAKEAVFNDCSKDSVALLRKNLKTLKIAEGSEAKVYTLDALVCLSGLKEPFDIIFIDPPYRLEVGAQAIEKIAKRGLLKRDGVLIFERDRAFEGEIVGLEKYDERKYGKTVLTFFRVKENEA